MSTGVLRDVPASRPSERVVTRSRIRLEASAAVAVAGISGSRHEHDRRHECLDAADIARGFEGVERGAGGGDCGDETVDEVPGASE